MNYVQWHVGDWIASTSLLSATERGVYMDLLIRYYKEERPIMQLECKRIARAYAKEEQEAMQYILEKFFQLENGAYTHKRCEEEISAFRQKSERRSNAAKSRLLKNQSVKSEPNANAYANAHPNAYASKHAKADANDVQSVCEPITNNQEPISNKEINKESDARTRKATKAKARVGEFNRESYVGLETVSDEGWDEWCKHRRRKRAVISQAVINSLAKEAEAVGMTLAQAMRTQVDRGWTGFKADWCRNGGSGSSPHSKENRPLQQDYHYDDDWH